MQIGAVLVLGGGSGNKDSQPSVATCFPKATPTFFGMPATLLDLLGEPILYRLVENLRKSGIGPIFLVTDDVWACHSVVKDISRWRVHVRNAPRERLRTATQAALTSCRESGSSTAVIMDASLYLELDFADMLRFHSRSGQPATFARDAGGFLGVAMVGTESAKHLDLPNQIASRSSIDYLHRQYTNRLGTPRELRRLAQDALLQRCRIRPNGNEVRPGVWVAPSARLHPQTRVVTPAYIGAHTRLRSGVVITHCTNVEHDCEIDRGSVVENATILPRTYLGSGLDIAHSIVNRNTVVDVRRAVEVEIRDRSLIGSTSHFRGRTSTPSPVRSLPLIGHSPWQRLNDAFDAFFPKRPLPSPAPTRVLYNASEAWPRIEKVSGAADSRAVRG